MDQGNVIGEEFAQYTADQIDSRQTINGLVSNVNAPISDKILLYQNNRNAWIKMASGVGLTELNKENLTPTGLNRLEKIIKDSNLPQTTIKKYSGTGLAKNFVLFNTMSSLNFEKDTEDFKDYTFRQGINLNTINQNWLDVDSTYGLGGTSMGFQPTPGITEISIDCVNRGSIRKANVKLKAFNRFQFDIIEMLYLRLGYTMMLEWGWGKYISSVDKETKDPIIEDMGSTIIDDVWFVNDNTSQLSMLREIESKRSEYGGNYDGFFGKVSNFNWTFNPDGSYDISIDLITLGSVIESLKVNLPANFNFEFASKLSEEDKEELEKTNLRKTSSLYKELGENIIARILRQYVIDYGKGDKYNPLYKSIDGSTSTEDVIRVNEYGASTTETVTNTDITTDFFITFKDFIDLLQTNVIDLDKNNNYTLDFETTPYSNYISANYNQIPFTPSVCMHNVILSEEFLIPNPKNSEKITKQNNSLYRRLMGLYSNIPSNFLNQKDGYIYGDLLNLYLNIEFITSLMQNNIDEKGNLSLYNLMTSLCEGLNDALGGLNNLEVIIKNDKIITVIDQNPIPGIKKITESSKVSPPQLEVFGYNNTKSNFLRDIKFETKIDSSLTTMISVGATGDGTSTKNYDATSFSKWNVGLTDRFSPDIINPSPTPIFQEEEIKRRKEARAWVDKNYEEKVFSSDRKGKYKKTAILENKNLDMERDWGFYQTTFTYEDSQSVKDNWVEESVKNMKIRLAKELRNSEIEDNKKDNYKFLLHYISGVNYTIHKNKLTQTGLIDSKDKLIVQSLIKKGELYNSSFSNKIKAAFREYINSHSNEKFKNKNEASGNIGFIPIHFNITLEGISGVKIYNKLNIDTRFLPSNYQNSLDFLINKVNHKVSNNDWQTVLGTMSTSNLENKKPEKPLSQPPTNNQTTTENPPTPETQIINNEEITNGEVPENYLVPLHTHFSTELSESEFINKYKGDITSDGGNIRLEKNASKAFADLLKQAETDRIHFRINSAYRTYNDQVKIKRIYGDIAAIPGTSDHGFGFAIDFSNLSNIKLNPTHKQYKWLKENADKYNIYRLPYAPKNKTESWEAWHWYYKV